MICRLSSRSASLILPSRAIRKFVDLMSRWRTGGFCACKKATARQQSLMRWILKAQDNPRPGMKENGMELEGGSDT